MKRQETRLPGVVLIEPQVFRDGRGYFLELWNGRRYAESGLPAAFVQDNVSSSAPNVLRGLHFQYPNPQGKLVSVLRGEVFDVVVDIRSGSPTFGQWEGFLLSEANARQLWVPEGFAHGFVVTADVPTLFSYKCTAFYDSTAEHSLRWDDPTIGIDWPVAAPTLSPKDAAAPLLADFDPARLPPFAR